MTIGELMNTLIQAVDCDSVDVYTQIIFCIPRISEYMNNFTSAKNRGKKTWYKTLRFNFKIIYEMESKI